jgi:GNAT superfamily N-acetyltransferase
MGSGSILTIGAVQARATGELLAAAFHEEPVSRWLEPDPARRTVTLACRFTGFTSEAFTSGSVELLFTGDQEEPAGAAVWFDRTRLPGDTGSGAPAGPGDRLEDPLFDAGEGSRWALFGQTLTVAHPGEPHDYLMLMGILPGQRGRGLGSRLLRRRLEWLDACGNPAYLEATSPASRALYARHGFRDHGRPIRLPGGPDVHPMWRVPERPRARPSTAGLTERVWAAGPCGGGGGCAG